MQKGIATHITVGLIATVLLCGCGSTVRAGAPVRIDHLTRLTVGVSTAGDVLLALGEPRGRGAARSAEIREAREILYYEYMRADGLHVDLRLLLVFLREGRYDGHLWFSTAHLPEETRR